MLPRAEDKTVYPLILDAADKKGESTFFIFQDQHVTYRTALLRIQKIANYLKSRGVGKEDRIIIYLDNCPELIYSYFAIIQLGAVSTMVNGASRFFELQSYILTTKPKLIITTLEKRTHLISAEYEIFNQQNIILVDGENTTDSIWGIVERENPYTDFENARSSDTASIIFSSAMDGFPLAVMLGHHGILNTSRFLSEIAEHDDVFMSILPFSHSYGLVSSFLVPLYKQVPFRLIQSFSRGDLVSLLKNDNVSIFSTIPRIYELLVKKVLPFNCFPKIRRWISGGQSMSDYVVGELIDKFGIVIEQGYGLTEASSIVSWNHLKNEKKAKSAGIVMPWNEVKTVDDEGRTLSEDEEGEIVVKGSNIMLGYYNNPQKTGEAIVDGWLYTGDIGKVDNGGYLYVTGRKKEMIIRNGINVYPKEVERILQYHPQINSVKVESKVSTHENGNTRERLSATIYPEKSGQLRRRGVLSWCMRYMASYNIPDQIVIK